MWEAAIESLNEGRIQKIAILCNVQRVLYREVIELWQYNPAFRDFFLSLLANAPFSAYFWETPAVTKMTLNQAFEFVLVNSPHLAMVKPDSKAFVGYFTQKGENEEIVTFPNLGKDAWLIVPCPHKNALDYSHLAVFVRQAPEHQKHALWQSVGSTLSRQLDEHPIWLSTSGLGVYWLHIRLDSFPKYYTYYPYKVSR